MNNCWAIESAANPYETHAPAVSQPQIYQNNEFSGVGNPEIYSPVVKRKCSQSRNSLHDLRSSSPMVKRRSIVIEQASLEVEGEIPSLVEFIRAI